MGVIAYAGPSSLSEQTAKSTRDDNNPSLSRRPWLLCDILQIMGVRGELCCVSVPKKLLGGDVMKGSNTVDWGSQRVDGSPDAGVQVRSRQRIAVVHWGNGVVAQTDMHILISAAPCNMDFLLLNLVAIKGQ